MSDVLAAVVAGVLTGGYLIVLRIALQGKRDKWVREWRDSFAEQEAASDDR